LKTMAIIYLRAHGAPRNPEGGERVAKTAPGRCLVCQAALEVKRLECPACGTGIDGAFGLCRFCRLSPDQRDFLDVFLAARGNIREVERVLGISYPTVRGRLNALLETLGYPADSGEAGGGVRSKREALQALEQGEIDVDEALRQMRKSD
jgi:hypothetical protein